MFARFFGQRQQPDDTLDKIEAMIRKRVVGVSELKAHIFEPYDVDVDTVFSKGQRMLHVACSMGSVEHVKFFLSMGATWPGRDDGGNTCIHVCTNPEILPLLLRADLECINNDGNTCLHQHVLESNLPMVTCLVKMGASVWNRNNAGRTLMVDAIRVDDLTPLANFEKKRVMSIEDCRKLKRTLRMGTLEDVARMVANGYDLKAKDEYGMMAIETICFPGDGDLSFLREVLSLPSLRHRFHILRAISLSNCKPK